MRETPEELKQRLDKYYKELTERIANANAEELKAIEREVKTYFKQAWKEILPIKCS